MGDGRNDSGLSRRHIMLQAEAPSAGSAPTASTSTSAITATPKPPSKKPFRALDDLVHQGKVLYVGVSNWTAWQIALGIGQAAALRAAPIHVIQPMYNLAKRTAEMEILPLAANQNLGVIS